jgi:hypothetical protein
MGMLNNAVFVRLLDKRIDKLAVGGYESLPDIVDDFYNVDKSTKAWLEYYSVGDVPNPVAFNGQRIYQSVDPGYHVRLNPLEYAGGIIIQRRLIDTEQYGVIDGWARGLGEAVKRLRNLHAHQPFLYMDTVGTDFMVNEEGVALCSNSHTTKSNVSTANGFDNLSTLPFNAVNLEAVRLQAARFRTSIGERYQSNFDTIVHPSGLNEEVWEVIKSEGKVDTMLNNANYQRGRWKEIELPLWDDYDTNNWAIVDSRRMKSDGLVWNDNVKPEFNNIKDFDTEARKYGSYAVWGWAWVNWRWICGCVVG